MFELVIQKIAARIPGWKRNLLTYPRRETSKSCIVSHANIFSLCLQNVKVEF
jgi:hypothetical protein